MLNFKRQHDEILEGRCDRCGQDLKAGQDGNANYALLQGQFGWPSQLDQLGSNHRPEEFHLCAWCWIYGLQLLGIGEKSEDVMHLRQAEWYEKRDLRTHLAYER